MRLGPRRALKRKRPSPSLRTSLTRRHSAVARSTRSQTSIGAPTSGLPPGHSQPPGERDRATEPRPRPDSEHGAVAALALRSMCPDSDRLPGDKACCDAQRERPRRGLAVELRLRRAFVAGEVDDAGTHVVHALRHHLVIDDGREPALLERGRNRTPGRLSATPHLDLASGDARYLIGCAHPDARGVVGVERGDADRRNLVVETQARDRHGPLAVGVADLVLEPERELPITGRRARQAFDSRDVAAPDRALDAASSIARAVGGRTQRVVRAVDRRRVLHWVASNAVRRRSSSSTTRRRQARHPAAGQAECGRPGLGARSSARCPPCRWP